MEILIGVSSEMAPTILFVPGFWEGSAPFSDVASLLQAQGYPTEIATLPSTGTVSPGNPSMKDDIDAIHSTVTKIVDKGHHVVLVLHAEGGTLGSAAIKGLSLAARREKRLEGGVSMIVFVVGSIFAEGYDYATQTAPSTQCYDAVRSEPIPIERLLSRRDAKKT